jgi:outer membrane protein OmpA-like peptidoglycan-associated protein
MQPKRIQYRQTRNGSPAASGKGSLQAVRFIVLFLLLYGGVPLCLVQAQSGIGIPSLKIIPGARQAGMAGATSGLSDDSYTLYTNPGGVGHLRRWQWALGYNRWFTDVYQADASFIKQLRLLGSTKTVLGLFASTVGMPPWDATGGKEEAVSAEHWTAGITLGQRLDWLHPSLAMGFNLKWMHNRLESYSVSSPALDAGLMFKPGRFRLGRLGLGIFDYGIFSAGVSILHAGPKIVFLSDQTLLPTTWRAGESLHLGRYQEWSCLLAADWTAVRGQDGYASGGAEIWWKNIIGCRAGYRADGKDLGDFSVGFGLRWENALTSVLGLTSRFGDAFQADFAEAAYGDVLKQTYRGTVTHYPLSPEPFHLGETQEIKSVSQADSHAVRLDWEKAYDPDPFDEVRYFLMVDPNRQKIESGIERLGEKSETVLEWTLIIGKSLIFSAVVPQPGYTVEVKEGGVYYWAVAAFDLAGHVCIARKGKGEVGQFIVAVPDLAVQGIEFTPVQKITTTPEQGTLSVRFSNQGSSSSGPFRVLVRTRPLFGLNLRSDLQLAYQTVFSTTVHDLAVGKDTTVAVEWKTAQPGWYTVQAQADPDSAMVEYRKDNNTATITAATVPKGMVSAPDSVEVMLTGYDSQEIPIVPEVYFALYSSTVDSVYVVPHNGFTPLLTTLADRMALHQDIRLKIYGSIDMLSGEKDPALADWRAQAVAAKLESLGVPADRIEVVPNHPQKILGKRPMPVNPQDAEWVMQQDRVVAFSVLQKDEEMLFQPYRFAVDTTMRDSVQFRIRLVSASGIKNWELESRSSLLGINKLAQADRKDSVSGLFSWKGTDQGKVVIPRNRWVPFTLFVSDTLGRTFSTVKDSIYIQEKRTVQRQELFGAAKFGQVEPVYAFYWDRVMSVAQEMIQDKALKLRLEGHACAIGPDAVNNKLSLDRAKSFTQAFLDRVKKSYPLEYQDIARRIAQPIGFGEKEPLIIKIRGLGDVLLGDNRSPVGRYLNRRIAILLYREH